MVPEDTLSTEENTGTPTPVLIFPISYLNYVSGKRQGWRHLRCYFLLYLSM